MRILGIRAPLGQGKYLGLPSLIGRKKREVFSFLREKVWQKTKEWESALISRAGKEVLLKSVVQSLATYAMGVFLLPISLCEDMEKLMNQFW